MKDKTEVKMFKIPKCDICGTEAAYDGKTTAGPWAYMCEYDFTMYGVGLGTGKGQRMILIEEGK